MLLISFIYHILPNRSTQGLALEEILVKPNLIAATSPEESIQSLLGTLREKFQTVHRKRRPLLLRLHTE
jgi:hypothetical protein